MSKLPRAARAAVRSILRQARGWVCLAVLVARARTGHAADPAWWQARGALTPGSPPAPDAVVNQGQLKWFTACAVRELNADLPGGAGDALNGLVVGWQQDYATNHYADDTNNPARPYKAADFDAVTVGQLKYIASLTDTRLQAAGLLAHLPAWIKANPATDATVAVAGQLKTVFNFDFPLDPSGSGLPLAWEEKYFGHTGVNPSGDDDGDGLTNLQEYQQGSDPNDFFNGQTPVLTIVSGDGQTGNPGGFAPQPLVVQVADATGVPVANAPVRFQADLGQVQAGSGSASGNPVSVRTDDSGQARVFFQLPTPASSGTVCTITASSPGSGQSAIPPSFHVTCDDGTGVYPSPFAPTNLVAQGNPDGSVDITWTNNSTDQTDIEIAFQQADGSWLTVDHLPAGTTSYRFVPNSQP